MTPEELDSSLQAMVKEQRQRELTTEAKTINLLRHLRANTQGTIDVVHVLYGALPFLPVVEKGLGRDFTRNVYNPKSRWRNGKPTLDDAFRAVRGVPDPSHTLLIADDGWRYGRAARKTHSFFRDRGYSQIWMLHPNGDYGEQRNTTKAYGFDDYNSVLCSSQCLFAYFDALNKEIDELCGAGARRLAPLERLERTKAHLREVPKDLLPPHNRFAITDEEAEVWVPF